MHPYSDPAHFFLFLASINILSINTTTTDIYISWETSLPYVMLFEISHTIIGDTTSVITTDQAVFKLEELSPNTNVQITIQPITACGPVGTAITLTISTDSAYMCEYRIFKQCDLQTYRQRWSLRGFGQSLIPDKI